VNVAQTKYSFVSFLVSFSVANTKISMHCDRLTCFAGAVPDSASVTRLAELVCRSTMLGVVQVLPIHFHLFFIY
jgi:hypothetical protein